MSKFDLGRRYLQKSIQKRRKNNAKTMKKRSKNDAKTMQKRCENECVVTIVLDSFSNFYFFCIKMLRSLIKASFQIIQFLGLSVLENDRKTWISPPYLLR